ncbi:hypothetical protein CEXT_509211 [Caerostris extrusa]|uniref:Uncharacterized protein n=1 Tax=Caerostris extrusa TaxID=172846 RepID=A0AAV4WSR6_CAEEX|nr:hypothetical protein CEXT_509211 [Caerostris extrusa]
MARVVDALCLIFLLEFLYGNNKGKVFPSQLGIHSLKGGQRTYSNLPHSRGSSWKRRKGSRIIIILNSKDEVSTLSSKFPLGYEKGEVVRPQF